MPDFSITDSLGNPVDLSNVNWTAASSLVGYLKSELLHLIVASDFIERKDKVLTQAAPKPVTFHLSAGHDFQLGNTKPEVDVKPGAEVELSVNATPGTNLFPDDSFHLPSAVPGGETGYVGLSITGSLNLGVSGSSGDLTFGIDRNNSITFEDLKAFSTGSNEPALGAATAAMLSEFVIPAGIADLARLGANDVRGFGAGYFEGFRSRESHNSSQSPGIAEPAFGHWDILPPGWRDGRSPASFAITGSYQIRLQKFTGGAIQLSYLKKAGTTFETDLTASAGVTADLGKTDLLAELLGAIETGVEKAVEGLTSDEIESFTAAVKAGVNHSLQASIDLALSTDSDNQISFSV